MTDDEKRNHLAGKINETAHEIDRLKGDLLQVSKDLDGAFERLKDVRMRYSNLRAETTKEPTPLLVGQINEVLVEHAHYEKAYFDIKSKHGTLKTKLYEEEQKLDAHYKNLEKLLPELPNVQ